MQEPQKTWVPSLGRRRAWQRTPLFLPGEPHGQRSLAGYSPWGRKETDTTERLHTHIRALQWGVFKASVLAESKSFVGRAPGCAFSKGQLWISLKMLYPACWVSSLPHASTAMQNLRVCAPGCPSPLETQISGHQNRTMQTFMRQQNFTWSQYILVPI